MAWISLLAAICVSLAGQTLLKAGAGAQSVVEQLLAWQTLVGLVLYGGAAMLYILALRHIPMSVALPCTALSYVAAILIGHFYFDEVLAARHLLAVGFICFGVLFLALA